MLDHFNKCDGLNSFLKFVNSNVGKESLEEIDCLIGTEKELKNGTNGGECQILRLSANDV
jgi:hypothetical protein